MLVPFHLRTYISLSNFTRKMANTNAVLAISKPLIEVKDSYGLRARMYSICNDDCTTLGGLLACAFWDSDTTQSRRHSRTHTRNAKCSMFLANLMSTSKSKCGKSGDCSWVHACVQGPCVRVPLFLFWKKKKKKLASLHHIIQRKRQLMQ